MFIIKYLLSWRFPFVTSIVSLGNCATWKIRDLEQRLEALSLNAERSVNSLLTITVSFCVVTALLAT